MKDNKRTKIAKGLGLLSGGGGLAGIILAFSGICLPCVLVPLGFVGAGLLFVFSFLSAYRWWLLGGAAVLLLLTFFVKRHAVCKIDPPRDTDVQSRASGWARLNDWKVYVGVPIVLLAIAVAFTLHLAGNRTGDLDLPTETPVPAGPYASLIGDAPTLGPADAKVTLIVYSDFFCPHCLALEEDAIAPILKKYGGRIRYASVPVNVLMNMGYPSTHAAYCAREQGRYWQMQKVLLERVRPFVGMPKSQHMLVLMQRASDKGTPAFLTRMAGTVDGIDTTQFLKCMKSGRYAGKIAETTNRFLSLGFNGVPVVLINGRFFTGLPTEESLSRAIDDALQDASASQSTGTE